MAQAKKKPASPPRRNREQIMVTMDGIGVISTNLRKRLRRFFEGVILLSTLNEACKANVMTRAPSDIYEPSDSAQTTLECFVNKLAQVCDNVPFGKTVTSLAIMVQNHDNLLYVFASNQRSLSESKPAQQVVRRVLNTVGEAQPSELRDDTSSPLFRRVLCDILAFHVERIDHYKKNLRLRIGRCIEDCRQETSDKDPMLEKELLLIQQLAASSAPEPPDAAEKSDSCNQSETLVRAAHSFRKSPVYEMAVERTRQGRMNESVHWSEFQHYIGRLASYLGVTRSIIIARKRIPELFEKFNIEFLESSTPLPNPMNALQPEMGSKRREEVRSSRAMIERMIPHDVEERVQHQQYAEELNRCGLDALLFNQAESPSFRPIIHCELLLLNHLCKEFDKDTCSLSFFRDVRYIGCSKPTCRLCEYYFAAHKSGIQVRKGHRNVYPNWVVPDVALENSVKAVEKDRMIDKVLGRVRDDALLALRAKVSDRKRFDSNTFSSQPMFQSLASATAFGDDLASRLGHLSIASGEAKSTRLPRGNATSNDDSWSVVVEQDEVEEIGGESEDEDGGVSLCSGGKAHL